MPLSGTDLFFSLFYDPAELLEELELLELELLELELLCELEELDELELDELELDAIVFSSTHQLLLTNVTSQTLVPAPASSTRPTKPS